MIAGCAHLRIELAIGIAELRHANWQRRGQDG